MEKTFRIAERFRVKLATERAKVKFIEMMRGQIESGATNFRMLQGLINDFMRFAEIADRSDDELEDHQREDKGAITQYYPDFSSEDFRALVNMVESLPYQVKDLPPETLQMLGMKEDSVKKEPGDMDPNELFDEHQNVASKALVYIRNNYVEDSELSEHIKMLHNIARHMYSMIDIKSLI